MPLTELWLSKVSRKRSPGRNGYDSPTRLSAPVALGVKIATYSSGDAWKKSSTAARACSTSSVIAAEVGLTECGLPKTRSRRSSQVLVELRSRVEAGAGVVEVDVTAGVEARELRSPELREQWVDDRLRQRCDSGHTTFLLWSWLAAIGSRADRLSRETRRVSSAAVREVKSPIPFGGRARSSPGSRLRSARGRCGRRCRAARPGRRRRRGSCRPAGCRR